MATIKDIARISGFSIGTVSRVINNHPDVSEATREKILQVIQEEHFQPNTNAKFLKQSSTSAITILIKGANNIFLESLLEAVQRYLSDADEEARVVFIEEGGNEVATAIQLRNENNPKGFIFLGGDLGNFTKRFGELNTPSVLISSTAKDLGFPNLSSFSTDDYAGGYAAMHLIVANGHKEVGIIGGFDSIEKGQASNQRIQGALDELKKKKLPFDRKKQYRQSLFSIEDGYDQAKNLLRQDPDITAIFALSDIIAIGAMRAILDLGKRVPDDISIVGFDGIEYSNYTIPRLTTIEQNIQEMASKGVDDLLFRIQYDREPVHTLVDFNITAGDSIMMMSDENMK